MHYDVNADNADVLWRGSNSNSKINFTEIQHDCKKQFHALCVASNNAVLGFNSKLTF